MKTKKRESVLSAAATMRVLNVMKHWVSKHYQVKKRNIILCIEHLNCVWCEELLVSFNIGTVPQIKRERAVVKLY